MVVSPLVKQSEGWETSLLTPTSLGSDLENENSDFVTPSAPLYRNVITLAAFNCEFL